MITLEESIRKLIDGMAETDRRMAKTDRRMAETDRKIAETNEKLAKSHATTEAMLAAEMIAYKEANHIGFEELRKSQRKTDNLFNTQWGRLVEALVNNQIIPLLQERGIPIQRTNQRQKGMVDGRNYEFDIIAENGDTIIVVEVKTTLRVDDVREFLDELYHFKQWLPRYSDMKVCGAVAFLHEASEASLYATKAGLFSILATGSSAMITNPMEFKPREF